jgi:uncharacterized protein YjbI with pentapeptide repeats
MAGVVGVFGVLSLAVWRIHPDGTALIVLLIGLALAAACLMFWKLPQLQADDARRLGDPKPRFELENEARRTLAEALGGLFLVIGLAVTWMQISDSRLEQRQAASISSTEQADAHDRSATEQALTREGQITDRYTAAILQLGNAQSMEVRVGGIYALQRIARDSPDDARTVMDVMVTFVRDHAPHVRPDSATTAAFREDGPSSPDADVQAALSVIFQEEWLGKKIQTESATPPSETGRCLDLSGLDLRGAQLSGTPLLPICFDGADLSGAAINQASLPHSSLIGSNLSGAELVNVDLREADLMGANFHGAMLVDANLSGADLSGADLSCEPEDCFMIMIDVNLSNTIIACSDLHGCTDLSNSLILASDLQNADLRGANLSGATIGCTGECADGYDQFRAEASIYAELPPSTELPRTDLSGAQLTGADLTDAHWDYAVCPDTTVSDLYGGSCEGHLLLIPGLGDPFMQRD